MSVDPRIYRFDRFTLDPRERQLLRDGSEVRLRPKAFETLLFLVERHGHLVTRRELMDGVWADTHVTDAVLTHCIAEARRALADDARQPRYLKTVSLAGYKFIAGVTAAGRTTPGSEARAADVHAGATGQRSGEPTPPAEPGVARLPTGVAAVAGGGPVATAAGGWAGAVGVPAGASAIAVLPFANLSTDPENEPLCDGLSEELINGLTQVRRLRVVAHSSSFSFKGRDIDVREIGRQLNVGSILEGSVRKSGDRLRISVQLIDALEGYHVWSEQYDRRLEDVFAIQDDIAAVVLARMEGAFPGDAPDRLIRRPTLNMDAYQLYLKGRGFWHRRYQGFLQRAMECFGHVIEMDPQFALAYTGLADSFSTLGMWGFAPPQAVFPKATELADRALAIDGRLAEAHASRGLIRLFFDWEWDRAGEDLARAIDLNPGSALIRLWNAHYLSIVGRLDEAIAEVGRAQDFDPLSPIVSANVGWTFYLAHDQERAVAELRKVLAVDPRSAVARFYLGFAYAEVGRYGDALASFRQAMEATGGMPWGAEAIGWIHGMAADGRAAKQVLRESEGRMHAGYVPSSGIALIHLGLGDDEAMFQWLTRALEERDALVAWLHAIPCFDRVRADPRYQAILDAAGLGDRRRRS